MTRHEVAEYTRVAYSTLARWAMEKRGPKFKKVGRRTLYTRTDVDAWIDSL